MVVNLISELKIDVPRYFTEAGLTTSFPFLRPVLDLACSAHQPRFLIPYLSFCFVCLSQLLSQTI